MKQDLKLCTIYVVTPTSGDSPASHLYVNGIGYPDSGALVIFYSSGGIASYAPGQWVSFHTETC